MDVPGYHLDALLIENDRALVYRGRSASGTSVVIKLPAAASPGPQQVASYQRGFELGTVVDTEAVLRPVELRRFGCSVALVADGFDGVPLASLIPDTGFRTGPLIQTALAFAAALARLHGCGILHQDVTPDSVLIDTTNGIVRFIGLDSARRIGHQPGVREPLEQANGSMAYMSPEQCGRMDCPVDQRSDLYSLGVAFFQLATGRLPFRGQDPATIAHAHIALAPPKVADQRSDIPPVFSEIVDRLLMKNLDARYASAAGLVYDLQRCSEEFQRTQTVRNFSIAARDISPVFCIPEQIYGRDAQRDQLLHAFDAVCRGERTLITVSGPSGIGKTAIVHTMEWPVVSQGGQFYSGKFDQFKRDQPYLAIVQAMRSMLRRELAMPDDALRIRRCALAKAVGLQGRLLTDVMPELQCIIGPQPEVDDAEPLDATRRFHGVFARFLAVFATPQSPLVVFVDDFQWADAASLKLLQTLASDPGLDSLTFVLGYRSNELTIDHPATLTLAELRRAADNNVAIELPALGREAITALVADTLHIPADEARALAAQIHDIAAGNVFFAREYLQALHERRFFNFDAVQYRWQWNPATLSEQSIPDSFVDLLTGRLAELPEDCLDLLDTASCVGSEFELHTIAGIHEIQASDAADILAPAVKKGILVPVGTGHVAVDPSANRVPEADVAGYRFQHDQVRQAVHDRLDRKRRARRHLHVGRLMTRILSKQELTSRAVEVFNHLIYCIDLVQNEERHDFARLGLTAGRTAQRELAFETARTQLRAAAGLLPQEAWDTDYETMLGINLALAESAYALNDTDEVEAVSNRILQHVKGPIDAARVHGLRIRVLSANTRYDEAVDICVAEARSLGVALPRKPGLVHVLLGVVRSLLAQGRRHPHEFEQLPEAAHPEIRAAVDLLNQSASAAYFAEPNLLPLIGTTSTCLSLSHGVCPTSAYGFSVWALVLCGVLGRIENGYAFGKLALAVARRFGGVEEARVFFVVTTFVRHWKEPLPEVAKRLHSGWIFNRNAGDEEVAVYCAGVLLYMHFFAGVSADADLLYRDEVRYIADSDKPHVKDSFLAWAQLYEALRSSRLPGELHGDWFDLAEKLPEFERTRNGVQIAISLIAAGILDHFAGRFERAETRFSIAAKWEDNIVGQVLVPGLAFFRALNLYRLYAQGPERRQWLRIARRCTARLRKWAGFAPFNLGHCVSLLNAEDSLVRGRSEEAVMALHRAADQTSHGAVFYQALATRRLAEVLARAGNISQAAHAESRACALFETWGSPALANSTPADVAARAQQPPATGGDLSGVPTNIEHMDLQSLLKMIAAISSEIDQGALLERLMVTLMQAASADRGLLLLLDENGTATVEADASVGAAVKRASIRLDDFPNLARPVVDLALRTGEPVVIDHAKIDGLLRHHPYVESSHVKSILALCVVLQGRTVGLIYLENHVAKGVFTPGRVGIIEALGAQAGVALENARLYGRVQSALEYQTALTAAHARRLEAEQAAAAKSRFLAAASHDLRQPLHALSLFVDVLKEEENEKERKNILPRIDASLDALRKLFDALLDISRLDANAVTPEYSHFDLAGLVESLADEFRSACQEKGLTLRVRMTPAVVVSDRLLLERVLRNLIGNAIRYTQSGGVLLSSRMRGDTVLVQVWDTGIGIAWEHQDEIFDEFRQLNNPHRDRNQGLGLGLAIVKRLCLLLHHPIALGSRPGKGSVFSLRVARGSRSMVVAEEATATAHRWALSGCRILVIDDEREILAAMQAVLCKWGCEVMVAVSLAEAETQLSLHKAIPDLIISDLRLRNGRTGVEAIDRLRARLGAPVPGILVTGETVTEQLKLAEGSGYALLQKPVLPIRLRTVIHQHLSNATGRALTGE